MCPKCILYKMHFIYMCSTTISSRGAFLEVGLYFFFNCNVLSNLVLNSDGSQISIGDSSLLSPLQHSVPILFEKDIEYPLVSTGLVGLSFSLVFLFSGCGRGFPHRHNMEDTQFLTETEYTRVDLSRDKKRLDFVLAAKFVTQILIY